jgi:hypothetical protein
MGAVSLTSSNFPRENPPVSLNPPEIVIAVFELVPYWVPELQRQFHQTNVTIRGCCQARDLFPAVADAPSAVLVIDLATSLTEIVVWLRTEVTRCRVRIPMIALGSAATAELEWLLRDAGVTAFLPDPTTGAELARLCRRQGKPLAPPL